MENWVKVLNTNINFNTLTNCLPTKGKLVYEYNPFRNYRLSENKYEYEGILYTEKELKDDFGIYLDDSPDEEKNYVFRDKNNQELKGIVLREKGELVDFITDELSFSLEHPVSIIPLYSYDGSVNLILNDGLNSPKMINSRFSATGKNSYEIVDRKGNNDTNIYDSGELFEIDTSLYKRINKIPKIEFTGVTLGGNLSVGGYHFYFKLADADGNETDFVGESGLVSIFIGSNPESTHTGSKNENSFKQASFVLTNLDSAYSIVTAYYSRYTAEGGEDFVTEYKKIDKKYLINNAGIANVVITGFEETINISASDINLMYNVVDRAKTLTTCLNMLFLGNVHKLEIPYNELADLSLRFLPYLKEELYPLQTDELYNISSVSKGYYDPLFIYNKTGYWNKEIYRFGIVYILPSNELTPVFNVRGGNLIKNYGTSTEEKVGDTLYSRIPLYNKDNERLYIDYNEEYNTILILEGDGIIRGDVALENVKGVCRFDATADTNTIYGVEFKTDPEVIEELKKYVKGYFFVRLTRIPLVLALGVTIGIDKISRTPCLPTVGGVIADIGDFSKTYIDSKDLNGINYISEGFLTRYHYKFKRKGGFWKMLSGILSMVAAVFSFIPGAGTLASTILSAASFILNTVVTGKFSVALFALAVASGASALGALKGAVSIGKVAGKVGETLNKVSDIMSKVATALNVVRLASVAAAIEGAVNVVQGISDITTSTGNTISGPGRNVNVPSGYKKEEESDSRQLIDNSFAKRIIIKDPNKVSVQAIICPDYEVNLAYYNLMFTGNEHIIRYTKSLGVNYWNKGPHGGDNYFTSYLRHFYHDSYFDAGEIGETKGKIVGVPDGVSVVGVGNLKFRAKAGSAEEAWKYEQVGTEWKDADKNENSDIVRGLYGSYLATDSSGLIPANIVEIMIPDYLESNMLNYFLIRMKDNSTFYAITDRFEISNMTKKKDPFNKEVEVINPIAYRGDCYICQFTHRLHRNFNDPSAPYNSEIVDNNTWKDNYNINKTEKYANINLGDVNAVEIGTWVTFKVRSSNNLNIRTLDGSNVDETAMTGHKRGYYPYYQMSAEGVYKTPESQIYNRGFSKSVSERWNFELPDVPYILNWFGTRIMYSDIHINDAYKNGYRTFLGTHYRDYAHSYGEIVKLVELNSDLICIFEHGVARIPVNERAVAGQGSGGNVYINTSNVLPENPLVLSDMFGSQWADSVLKTPGKSGDSKQYIYGVDTIAKKIWRTDGLILQCISDFKVQEFLNNNITLGERELTPKIGIRNVKTVYNSFKRDVMFTFYDNTYGFEEKVWNLCWNELLEKFITFYSWVPSYMENINNIPFSFDRNTSKWMAKLGTSHTKNSFADGITLSNVVINNRVTYYTTLDNFVEHLEVDNYVLNFKYIRKDGTENIRRVMLVSDPQGLENSYFEALDEPLLLELVHIHNLIEHPKHKFIAFLTLSNRIVPDVHYDVDFELVRDQYGNHEMFEIKKITTLELPQDAKYAGQKLSLYGLYFKDNSELEFEPVKYLEEGNYLDVRGIDPGLEELTEDAIVYLSNPKFEPKALLSELYYRNSMGHAYADYDAHKLGTKTVNTKYIPVAWFEDTKAMEDIIKNYPAETKVGNSPFRIGKDGAEPINNPYPCTTVGEIANLLEEGTYNGKSLPLVHKIPLNYHWVISEEMTSSDNRVHLGLPIFKDITGKRPMLPKGERLNEDKLVINLNIKAHISIVDTNSSVDVDDAYYNMKAGFLQGTTLIDAGYYESSIAITPKWNLLFLSTDFWKHGQAGIIDIADDIYPTYWYGKQHPFEFECIVVNDPSVHKIFTNLELVANKAKPESFHYEVVGETYDFARDKVNMYFRQEALKALWQYNGADISYDRNFLKVLPRLQAKSADLPHRYYARQDTINEIEDYYTHIEYPRGYDYRHLSGAEIVYYPTRLEFRIWNHALAVSLDDLSLDDARSIISANCKYLEDRWKITINPILVCYKNEYSKTYSGALIQPNNSTWPMSYDKSSRLPSLPIYNSPIPLKVLDKGEIEFPGGNLKYPDWGKENALYNLYDLTDFDPDKGKYRPLDLTNWLNDVNIYKYDFGEAHNRKEVDVRDKFLKVRIRYSGEELAVIDFLNTIYRVSYA